MFEVVEEVIEIYKPWLYNISHPSISIIRTNIQIEKKFKNQFTAVQENNSTESNQFFKSGIWLPHS